MLGTVRAAFPYRIPGPNFGRYGSLVMVAPCNMACSYCDVGGYDKDAQHRLPGWRTMSVAEMEQFVDEEVDAGRVIYLTGGEPLMFPELVVHLGTRVRERGGYSILCTNASFSARLDEVSACVDEFSVSLKGSAAMAERVSGLQGKMAFDVPYRNTLQLLDYPNTIELVVVLFDGLDVDTICALYEPFFGRAHITLKEFRPKVTRAQEDHSYRTELITDTSTLPVQPISVDDSHVILDELVLRYPQHAETFHLVTGGGGEQGVRSAAHERVFVR